MDISMDLSMDIHIHGKPDFFPTPPLVSPKFPHVPWEYVDRLLITRSEGVGLIVRAISFQDFQPM